MAFWSAWFAPKCDGCGEKILDTEPNEIDGRKLCDPCNEARLEAEAKKEAEIAERRRAEEEARAKLEGLVDFTKGARGAAED